MVKKIKKDSFDLHDLSSTYKGLSEYENKKITILSKNDIEEKEGRFGKFLGITLADGNKVAVSSNAIIDKLAKVIAEDKLPFSAVVVKKDSVKNKGRFYYDLA